MIYILLLSIFLLLNNCTYYTYIKNSNELKNDLFNINSQKKDINEILEVYNIKNPNNIIISDINYYYLYAKLFYENKKYDEWFNYYIQKAIKSENLFKNDAIQLYITYLLENKDWQNLKNFVINYQNSIKENDLKI